MQHRYRYNGDRKRGARAADALSFDRASLIERGGQSTARAAGHKIKWHAENGLASERAREKESNITLAM